MVFCFEMKKGIHPKLQEVEVELGDGYKFTMLSTYKRDKKITYSHYPFTKDNLTKNLGRDKTSRAKIFEDRYAGIYSNFQQKEENEEKNED